MMFEHKAEPFLNLSRDAKRQATVSCIGSLSGASTPVTDRLLLESAPTPARSLEGCPLTMGSSLMLPDRSRLRLLESWPRFAAAFGEQRRPMAGSGGQAESTRRGAEADARAFGEGGKVMHFGMFVPWAVAAKRVVGRVQQAVARRVKWILF
jgi:hypothetical protein